MADIDESAAIVAVWPYAPGAKRLIVASDGNGFIVGEDELLSSTRKGRAVLNVSGKATAALIVAAAGDHVAVDRPEPQAARVPDHPSSTKWRAARARGCSATRTAASATPRSSSIAEGLTWRDSAGRTFTVSRPELDDWIGNRAEAGRLPPKGFPKNNRFEG